MFTLNFIIADDVLETTGMTQNQLDLVIAGIEQAAELWSRYIDGNNAVIDIGLDFVDLSGSTLAQAGSSFFSRNNGPFESEVINELNGGEGVFAQDGTFTVDLPSVLNDRFFYADNLDFEENPGAIGQIDFLTLAAHELGHVLGFLDLSFEGFVVNNEFIGANAVAANGGNPVPLADGVHTEIGDLLGPIITSNTRYPINEVLVAILQDIGVRLVQATNGANTLYGFQQSNDTLDGQGGNDELVGFAGNDTLNGGEGADILNGGAGADILDGGTGVDTASYEGSIAGVSVNLGTGLTLGGDALGDTLIDVENLTGSDLNDTFIGDDEANALAGGDGADRLFGRDGEDTLNGGAGDDRLFGGNQADELFGGDNNDLLFGQSGDDELNGDAGDDKLFGSLGEDVLNGGDGEDDLFGGSDVDILNGNDDNDELFGGAAGDELHGGEGDDTLVGESGLDTLFGDAGEDLLLGGSGSDMLFGGAENDRLFGSQGLDVLNGGTGDDTLGGGDNGDTLNGDEGADFLSGQAGNDILNGGTGNDRLLGGTENDRLDGGLDNDTLTGGSGNDIFVFSSGSGFDQINDFDDDGNDRVDLTSYGFMDYATQVEANLVVNGAHVDLVLGTDTLRFRNADLADIGADDFILI
jgi:Ca2+-binding RTX toxin-like protein